jgi:hypothetical protein
MSFNMFDLTYRVARELGVLQEGTATGGSTTTLIDTVYLTQDDDFWNGGTVWVTYDAGAAAAAPEGEWARITDHVSTTKTITCTAVTAAIAAADLYAVADSEYKRGDIVSQINRSLADMGEIIYTDTTTITTADDQTEYTLPTGLAAGNLKEVWLQGEDDDADDNRWTRIYNWDIQITATGTAEELILQYQYASGYAVKLVYVAPHPQMYTRTSNLSETIPLPNILYPSVLNLLRFKKAATENPKYDTEIVKYETKVAQLAPLFVPRKQGKLLTLGATGTLESEPGKVYL